MKSVMKAQNKAFKVIVTNTESETTVLCTCVCIENRDPRRWKQNSSTLLQLSLERNRWKIKNVRRIKNDKV